MRERKNHRRVRCAQSDAGDKRLRNLVRVFGKHKQVKEADGEKHEKGKNKGETGHCEEKGRHALFVHLQGRVGENDGKQKQEESGGVEVDEPKREEGKRDAEQKTQQGQAECLRHSFVVRFQFSVQNAVKNGELDVKDKNCDLHFLKIKKDHTNARLSVKSVFSN